MINFSGLTGQIVARGMPGYDEARQGYNGRFEKFPLAIVYCLVKEDVVNAIKWVRKYSVPFRIRDGGHSYEAFSLLDDGLVIDVSRLLEFEIDPASGTAKVGAGFLLMSLYEALWKEHLVIPAGTCATVGVSGLTLGGGFGHLSRLMGLTSDNLTALEMVTAQGQVVEANADQHPNLFWACRGGGGGNFGVATRFTFKTHTIDQVARYRFSWDFDDLEEVVRAWQAWAPYADAHLSSFLTLPGKGQADIRSSGLYVGSESELKSIANLFLEAVPPKTVEFKTMSWIEAADSFSGIVVRQELFKNSSAYIHDPLPNKALDVLRHFLENVPGPVNVASFEAYGGAVARIPPGATAFAHRDALMVLQYQSYWQDNALDADSNIHWVELFRRTMLPFTSGAYCNYCDILITDWPNAYYAENLSRLERAKKTYDPENLFHFQQSIPRWSANFWL